MLKIRPISAELLITAKEELNEVTDRISKDVDALREWISRQPHLNPSIDDQLLVTFLRGCKYSLERTKSKIDTYFTMKTTMPELSDRDPTDPVLLEIIRLGLFVVLPTSNEPGGPRVLIIRMFVYKPGQFKIASLLRVFTMVTEILTRDDDNFAISGLQIFCDLTNVGWTYFLELEPSHVKKFFSMIQDALPARFKGIHYYRAPTGFETFVNLVRSFLNEKNKERLICHGENMESIYNIFPKTILPVEYLGEAGSIQDIINVWEKKLSANKDYFKEMEKFATDENKRQKIVEISGSFRKLDVD